MFSVRCYVAANNYGLDILINDKSSMVRAEVAKQKYGLEKLINDEDYHVRCAVAYKGYGLDKLINDENEEVRAEVTRQGYNLEKLIDDKSYTVHDGVNEFLNEKADDSFIIDLGNKLLDKGYKLSTNGIKNIFTDETCTKFREFHGYGTNGLVYQVLARLLWKNIRVKEIYNPEYPKIVKIYLNQKGLSEKDI